MSKMFKFLRKHSGATTMEYGIVAVVIAIAGITAITGVGTKLRSMSSSASSN